MITNKLLNRDFQGKIFNIEGVDRECNYCSLEDGGAWIWLNPNKNDNCDKINFIIKYEYSLSKLYRQVENNESISPESYGYLVFQNDD